MRVSGYVFALTALLCAAETAQAHIIHVPTDEPDIASGLHAASSGDTVLLAPGVYDEHDLVMKSGVCLRGSAAVLVDAGFQRAMTATGVSAQTAIENIAFTNGRTPDTGGALVLIDAPIQLRACCFVGNTSIRGGGVYLSSSDACFVGCHFLNNEADVPGIQGAWAGGAVYCSNSSPEFSGCVFEQNRGDMAGVEGGAICVSGAGASPVFSDCLFLGNMGALGGAASVSGSATATFEGSRFIGNIAAARGGAVHIGSGGSSSSLVSCTLAHNGCSNGSGLYVDDSAGGVNVDRCIVAFGAWSQAVRCIGSMAVSCSDIFGNTGGDWSSCLVGDLGINGNFCTDPLFCDDTADDYSLCSDSPCLPGNHPDGAYCSLIGAQAEGCGPCGSTTVKAASWGRIKAEMR